VILRDVSDILRDSGNIDGDIQEQITKDNSMTTIPVFIGIWNTRLAFIAERYRLGQTPSDKGKIADEALVGLDRLLTYFEKFYSDPKRGKNPCVVKDTATELRLNGGVGSNWSEKVNDVSTQYCYGNGRVLKQVIKTIYTGRTIYVRSKKEAQAVREQGYRDRDTVNLGGVWYMRSTDMGKDRGADHYLFARRMDHYGKRYFLEKTGAKAFARILRNHYIVKYHKPEFGDLSKLILGWVDVVKATGNRTQYSAAINQAIFLGIGWNTLRKHHGNADFNSTLSQLRASFKRRNETREIND
jgi:hypothetical protein